MQSKLPNLFYAPLLTLLLAAGCGAREETGGTLVTATNSTLSVWSTYPGKLEARRVEIILSRFNGSATIVDLARNGESVYFTYNSTDTAMGDHLTKEKCEATLPQAADDFAAQVVRFILKGKPPP